MVGLRPHSFLVKNWVRDEVNLNFRRDANCGPQAFCCGAVAGGYAQFSASKRRHRGPSGLGTCNAHPHARKYRNSWVAVGGLGVGNKLNSQPDSKCLQVEALPEGFYMKPQNSRTNWSTICKLVPWKKSLLLKICCRIPKLTGLCRPNLADKTMNWRNRTEFSWNNQDNLMSHPWTATRATLLRTSPPFQKSISVRSVWIRWSSKYEFPWCPGKTHYTLMEKTTSVPDRFKTTATFLAPVVWDVPCPMCS